MTVDVLRVDVLQGSGSFEYVIQEANLNSDRHVVRHIGTVTPYAADVASVNARGQVGQDLNANNFQAKFNRSLLFFCDSFGPINFSLYPH